MDWYVINDLKYDRGSPLLNREYDGRLSSAGFRAERLRYHVKKHPELRAYLKLVEQELRREKEIKRLKEMQVKELDKLITLHDQRY